MEIYYQIEYNMEDCHIVGLILRSLWYAIFSTI